MRIRRREYEMPAPPREYEEKFPQVENYFAILLTLHHLSSKVSVCSSGSIGRVCGGEKYEIYAATIGSHLFYDLFLQGSGGSMTLSPPDPLLVSNENLSNNF